MGCLKSFALMLLCAVAGYAVIAADPNLPGQAIAAGASSVQWLTGALSTAGHATAHPPTPTGNPTSPAPVSTAPIVVVTPTATTAPTVAPPRAPIPVVTPRPVARPTAAPTPRPTAPPAHGWTFPWDQSDLSWAINTLTTDRADDTQAESTYPAQAAYYAGWASHWTQALQEIAALQYPQTAPPPSSYLSQVGGWFQQAYELHLVDEEAYPQNTWWDSEWMANYTRLSTLWGQL